MKVKAISKSLLTATLLFSPLAMAEWGVPRNPVPPTDSQRIPRPTPPPAKIEANWRPSVDAMPVSNPKIAMCGTRQVLLLNDKQILVTYDGSSNQGEILTLTPEGNSFKGQNLTYKPDLANLSATMEDRSTGDKKSCDLLDI